MGAWRAMNTRRRLTYRPLGWVLILAGGAFLAGCSGCSSGSSSLGDASQDAPTTDAGNPVDANSSDASDGATVDAPADTGPLVVCDETDQCDYVCDDPTCTAMSDPDSETGFVWLCEPSTCHCTQPHCTREALTNDMGDPLCEVTCDTPSCEVMCPECAEEPCEPCSIVCDEPNCVTHCQAPVTARHCTTADPQCEVVCDEPACVLEARDGGTQRLCDAPNCHTTCEAPTQACDLSGCTGTCGVLTDCETTCPAPTCTTPDGGVPSCPGPFPATCTKTCQGGLCTETDCSEAEFTPPLVC